MNKLKKLPEVYKSRRGYYQLVEIENPTTWTPVPLGDSEREIDVMAEVLFAQQNKLAEHKYWKDEDSEFVTAYERFYTEMFGLTWIGRNESRQNVIANATCCLSLVQYHNNTLYAYSRSTDMRNGFHSDKIILDYLAQSINKNRPDCVVSKISWFLAVPHAYLEKGIARRHEWY